MNRSVVMLPFLAVVALAGAPAVAAEFAPESRVAEVIVYRQGALVVREARLSLTPGSHRVVLKGLPSLADPDSVRASGTGATGIEIGGVEVQQEFGQPVLTPEYRLLEQEVEALGRQLSLLNDRQQSIAALREFLSGLKSSTGQSPSKDALTKGFAVESWVQAYDFFSSRLNVLSEEARALETKQKELAQRSEIARGAMARMTSQGGIARWNATVLVSAPRGGGMTLRASYLAAGAAWQPFYDARLDPASERVSLSWQAQVAQTTGEDWKDVAVTLATTRPSAGIDLPELAPLLFAVHQPATADGAASFSSEYIDALPVLGRNQQGMLTLAPEVSEGDGSRVEEEKAQGRPVPVAVAEAARREVAVTFALPGRLDVPSDGRPHRHLIATQDMDARVEHHAVPLIAPDVHLVAKVTLPGEVPLLPGKVQHFVGGDLVGTSWMAGRAAGEEFLLSFGPDDRLKAERKQIARLAERRGKDDEIAYRFVTTLENHLGRDGVVEVKDRLPVSGDERIVVTLDDETTPGSLGDSKEPGILTWKVPVPKGGQKEIVLTYRVRSPRGVVVAGLP